MCSWSSEPESLCNNWRGWKRPITTSAFGGGPSKKSPEGKLINTVLAKKEAKNEKIY